MSAEHIKIAQRALGVPVDGDFGPGTLKALMERIGPTVDAERDAMRLPWMREAWAVLGLHEARDKDRLSAWLKSGGKRLGDPAALPWCGDFVETALALGLPGEKLTGPVAENPFWARNWLTFGVRVTPAYGAVLVFARGPQSGHVGFAVGQDDDEFFVLGGNQGDTVSVVPIAKGRLLGARWPLCAPMPTAPLPRMRLNVARSTNEA